MCFEGEGDDALFVVLGTDITSKDAFGVTAAHHPFHDFLHVGPLPGCAPGDNPTSAYSLCLPSFLPGPFRLQFLMRGDIFQK